MELPTKRVLAAGPLAFKVTLIEAVAFQFRPSAPKIRPRLSTQKADIDIDQSQRERSRDIGRQCHERSSVRWSSSMYKPAPQPRSSRASPPRYTLVTGWRYSKVRATLEQLQQGHS